MYMLIIVTRPVLMTVDCFWRIWLYRYIYFALCVTNDEAHDNNSSLYYAAFINILQLHSNQICVYPIRYANSIRIRLLHCIPLYRAHAIVMIFSWTRFRTNLLVFYWLLVFWSVQKKIMLQMESWLPFHIVPY